MLQTAGFSKLCYHSNMSYRDDSGARCGPWNSEMREKFLNGDNFKSKKKFKMFMKKAAVERRKAGTSELLSKPRCTKAAILSGALWWLL